jgi:hypothetical protein
VEKDETRGITIYQNWGSIYGVKVTPPMAEGIVGVTSLERAFEFFEPHVSFGLGRSLFNIPQILCNYPGVLGPRFERCSA